MKKIFVFLGVLLLVCGCGKTSDKDVIKNMSKKVENCDSYHMNGTLEIYRNEEKYTYSVDSSYKKGDFFKVNLINQNNNHEQIILKNKEGVFVITPSLNKSFKFQSDWPYNNSQIYLLQPIIADLKNDNERKFEKTSDGYVISSKVNYSSERDFVNQKIYVDEDNNITKVEVLDSNNLIRMRLTVIDIDYKAKFDDNYFESSSYQKEQEIKKENQENSNQDNQQQNSIKEETQSSQQSIETSSSKINDIVYPMYVPVDTQLSGQDIVETANGERVILTFTGESAFTVVQETVSDDAEFINYVYGDPYLILDTVGSVTDYSVSWISNGVEYSVMSDAMKIDELLTVAQSISVKAVGK